MSTDNQSDTKHLEQQIEVLYKQCSTESPSQDLDEKILSQARSQLDAKERKSQPELWRRVSSIAASFAVVVTIGLVYKNNQSLVLPESEITIQESFSDADTIESEVEAFDGLGGEIPPLERLESVDETYEQAASNKDQAVAEMKSTAAASAPKPVAKKAKPKSVPVAAPEAQTNPAFKLESSAPLSTQPRAFMAKDREVVNAEPLRKTMAVEDKELAVTKVELIQKIHDAISHNELEKAKMLWQELRAVYPEEQLPEDLRRFFGSDL